MGKREDVTNIEDKTKEYGVPVIEQKDYGHLAEAPTLTLYMTDEIVGIEKLTVPGIRAAFVFHLKQDENGKVTVGFSTIANEGHAEGDMAELTAFIADFLPGYIEDHPTIKKFIESLNTTVVE